MIEVASNTGLAELVEARFLLSAAAKEEKPFDKLREAGLLYD